MRAAVLELLRGHGSPGGVAIALRALERALPLLDGDRHALVIRTAFGGPGARDAFELMTAAVSDGRYTVDPALRRPELGVARERFVFTFDDVTVVIRDGFVTDEFAALAFAAERSPDEQARLEVLKRELADRVLAAQDVFDVV